MKLKYTKLLSFLVFPIGILAISSSSILTRLGQAGAPSLVIATYRLIIAGSLLFLYVIIKNKKEFEKVDRQTLKLFLFAALFLAAHFASWITSLEYTSIASSVVLVTTTPVWVAIYGVIFYAFHHFPADRKSAFPADFRGQGLDRWA